MTNNSKPLSIYIHWPFCLSLCPYCDFNSHISNDINHKKWLESYELEIAHFSYKIKGRKIKSIFFGGGTPSLMKPSTVEGIIKKISDLANISSDTEITLEANPTSYETDKFKEFKRAGINRVSIGVQSLDQKDLEILGRKHSAKEAIYAIESAAKIFDNYSFDLIYAILDQTLEKWQKEIKFALSLAAKHISLYQLTIEKGTPFYKLFRDGKLVLPSNNISADMYEWTNEYLSDKNYNRYEISNYALDGYECIHNLSYWNYEEYIGIGPGAHSRLHNKDSIESVMMTHKPTKWLDMVSNKNHGIQIKEKLTQQEIIEETLMMGLRLEKGISEDSFFKITGKKFHQVLNQKTTEHYIQQNLLTMKDKQLSLTDRGLMLHNYLVPRICEV